jgi:hypothetical protein
MLQMQLFSNFGALQHCMIYDQYSIIIIIKLN